MPPKIPRRHWDASSGLLRAADLTSLGSVSQARNKKTHSYRKIKNGWQFLLTVPSTASVTQPPYPCAYAIGFRFVVLPRNRLRAPPTR